MIKFFKKLNLQQTTKRSNYLKEDLFIFSRKCDDDVSLSHNAEKFIKKDKKYCFVGIFNNNKTKVKNVLTGEIYPANFFGVTEVNGVKYQKLLTSPQMEYESKNNWFRLKLNNIEKLDFYKLNNEIIKIYCHSETYLYEFISPFKDVCSLSFIKELVKEINNKIHENYKESIQNHKESLIRDKQLTKSKLTPKERDF